jgi:serine/threonine protein kinase
VKIYKSPTVYEHAKRCLTLLAKEDFVPNILYYSDADLTIVEEDRGQLTMMNAAIPLDFDQQIHRMICILHHRYKIIHRDIAYTNFVVDPQTGFVSLIDFGDAFVAHTSSDDVIGVSSSSSSSPPPSMQALKWWKDVDNWNGRNLINLLNIWLSTYDENERVEQFITDTIPHIYGKRQWRPPPQKWRLNTNDETGRRTSHDTRP